MTNLKIQEVVVPLLEMKFDLKETMKVLTLNKIIYFTWGVSKLINVRGQGLLLNVNGHHHKGSVLITLNWSDTYTVTFISRQGRVLKTNEMVYFDNLVEIIDNYIERIPEYKY